MRWEMGFSASEIASTAFALPPLGPSVLGSGCALNSCLGTGAGVVASNLHNLIANWRGSPSRLFEHWLCNSTTGSNSLWPIKKNTPSFKRKQSQEGHYNWCPLQHVHWPSCPKKLKLKDNIFPQCTWFFPQNTTVAEGGG
jgi:hypothetical protein